jgi:hypothetical protein
MAASPNVVWLRCAIAYATNILAGLLRQLVTAGPMPRDDARPGQRAASSDRFTRVGTVLAGQEVDLTPF